MTMTPTTARRQLICECGDTQSCAEHPVMDSASRLRDDDDAPFSEKQCCECHELYSPGEPCDESICSVCASKPAARLREVEERAVSALASVCEAEGRYRIERRHYDGGTAYWDAQRGGWRGYKELATVYTEAERQESLMQALNGDGKGSLPPGGCWVLLDPVAAIECDRCETVVRDATARQLAEKVYGMDWLVMATGLMCKSCQARGIVTREDAMVDEDDVLNGD